MNPSGRRLLVSLAIVGLLASGCRSPATTSVDDLARALTRSEDDVGRWADELRAANNGSDVVDEAVATQLRDRTGAVNKIWSAAKDVSDLACQAWTNGGDKIAPSVFTSAGTAVEAQTLLNNMYADEANDSLTRQSITIACELAGLASSGI